MKKLLILVMILFVPVVVFAENQPSNAPGSSLQFLGKKVSIGTSMADFKKKYTGFKLSKNKTANGVVTYKSRKGNAGGLFLNNILACISTDWSEEMSRVEQNQYIQLDGFNKIGEKIDSDQDQPMYSSYRFDFAKGDLIAKESGVTRGDRMMAGTVSICDKQLAEQLKAIDPGLVDYWF